MKPCSATIVGGRGYVRVERWLAASDDSADTTKVRRSRDVNVLSGGTVALSVREVVRLQQHGLAERVRVSPAKL